MATVAEKISGAFDHDSDRRVGLPTAYGFAAGADISALCICLEVDHEVHDTYDRPVKHWFKDGSCLVVGDDYWYIGCEHCWCQLGNHHDLCKEKP